MIPKVPSTTPLNSGSQSKLYVKNRLDNSDWSEDDAVPLSRELGFQPTGTVVTVPLFGEEFDRAVKTGKGGTMNLGSVAPDGHPVIDLLNGAGDATGPNAQIKFLVVNPDNRAYVGYTVVEVGQPQYDSRGVFGYNYNTTLDGKYIPFKIGANDILPAVVVTSVTPGAATADTTVGQTVDLDATVAPAGARQNLLWTSENPAIALVDQNGVVTGVSAGNATIRVRSAYDQSISATVTVTVA